jgi:hypothetical protein
MTTKQMTTKQTIFAWPDKCLEQTHTVEQSILIVSGCSFTDACGYTTVPITWPGYAKERCGFDYVIDVSSGGCGNDYIATSIVNQIESMTADELKQLLVLIMWTGVDRQELPTYTDDPAHWEGYIDGVRYIRGNQLSINSVSDGVARGEALRSWKNIMLTQNYLENKGVPFGFSFYINEFDPPFIPRRDLTKEFFGMLAPAKIEQLRHCRWIHPFNDSPFEWAFYQKDNLFEPDGFHLSPNGHLRWTDNILLPNLVKMGLSSPVDKKKSFIV